MVGITGKSLLPDPHRGVPLAGPVQAQPQQEVILGLEIFFPQSCEQGVRLGVTSQSGRRPRQEPEAFRVAGHGLELSSGQFPRLCPLSPTIGCGTFRQG